MPRPSTITGHLVAPARAHAVVAPPYDALTPEQRSAMAAADPESFLNALPASGPGDGAELERTLVACRATVERLVSAGRFLAIDRPCLGVVGLGAPPDRTVAVVGDLPVEAFDLQATGQPGLVRPHERVDPARVEQLTRYLEVVRVASSPVATTHRPHPAVSERIGSIVEQPAEVGFQGDDGTDIAVWLVHGDDADGLADAIAQAGTLYIADGHHRAAAVAEYTRRDQHGSGQVLSAMIASDQLHVAPFHRRIIGAPDPTADGVARRLRGHDLLVRELDGPQVPPAPGAVTVTAEGRWWLVQLPPTADADDPVEGLDVRRMERSLLPALLDTGDEGSEPELRVEPSPAPAGLGALEGPATIGVALAPTGIEAMLQVADARGAMPPKTTYITPKLRSGLFLVPR